MAEEEPTTTEVAEETTEPVVPFLAAAGPDRANLVLSLASAILNDGSAEFTVGLVSLRELQHKSRL